MCHGLLHVIEQLVLYLFHFVKYGDDHHILI